MSLKRFYALILAVSLCMLWSACGPNPHEKKVSDLRAKLPFTSVVKTSVSMHGFQPGDRLLVTASPYSAIKPGDHVYLWTEDKEIPSFHLAVRPIYSDMPPHNRWLTHGDANENNDTILLTEQTYIGSWTRSN